MRANVTLRVRFPLFWRTRLALVAVLLRLVELITPVPIAVATGSGSVAVAGRSGSDGDPA